MPNQISDSLVLQGLWRTADAVEKLTPQLSHALKQLESGAIFSLAQGQALAAMVLDHKPDLVIDLGTGSGASSFCMALAADWEMKVYTFDINDNWNYHIKPRAPSPPPSIVPMVCDITQHDFSSMIERATRVLVFLDAHGFEVAARLLSHIMPQIADKPHLVLCHDISDNRLHPVNADRGYNGKRMWRGSEDYFKAENTNDTAYVHIGWMTTAVEQGIVIQDFCYRNRLTFRSFDLEFNTLATPEERISLSRSWGHTRPLFFGITYFTMQETVYREFPRC